MNNELLLFPRTIVNKTLLKGDLDRYISADSLQQLILALRKYHRDGLLSFEVRLDPSYVEQQDALSTLKTRTDVLLPTFGIWAYRNNADGLGRYYSEIEAKKPLNESQSADIIEKLPTDTALKYFQFKITYVDWELLVAYIANQPKKPGLSSKQSFGTVKYKGLKVDGIKVSYKERLIPMGNQHTQVVRLLVDHADSVCTYEDFFDSYASIFSNNEMKNPTDTLIKLISAVRKELKLAVGYNCIISKPGIGWYLQLS